MRLELDLLELVTTRCEAACCGVHSYSHSECDVRAKVGHCQAPTK
jgi:hypothetical protein